MSYKITLPYDPIWTALQWAKANCPSYITNHATGEFRKSAWANNEPEFPEIAYVFSEEKDAVLFALRWK